MVLAYSQHSPEHVGWCMWGDFKNQRRMDCSLLQKEIEFGETQTSVFLAV